MVPRAREALWDPNRGRDPMVVEVRDPHFGLCYLKFRPDPSLDAVPV